MDISTLSTEYWENIIVFATIMFGGFEDMYQVFNYFDNEIETVARRPIPSYNFGILSSLFEETAEWKQVVSGVFFRMWVGRPIGGSDEYIWDIFISSDRGWYDN